MSLEAYASAKRDEIHTDVLLQARQACYKVLLLHFHFFDLRNLLQNKPLINVGFFFLDLGLG